MKLKILTLSVLFLSTFSAFSQTAPENYVDARMVNAQGDTVKIKMKQDKDERMSSGITVWDETTKANKKYQPKDVAWFQIENDQYFAKLGPEGKKVFMESIIQGEASLYRYTFREKKGNDRETVIDFYVEKKGKAPVLVPAPSKFKKEMSAFFLDAPQLVEKIDKKLYTKNDVETIVTEYNEWIKAGKPNNDDRFSADNMQPVLVNKNKDDGMRRVGLEIPLYAAYNFVNFPTILNQVYKSQALGFGYDFGIGARIRVKGGFSIKAGINVRNKGFRASSDNVQVFDQAGTPYILKFKERANLLYPGIYVHFIQEWPKFFIGGGFNASFYSKYYGNYNYQIYGQNGGLLVDETVERAGSSYLVNELLANTTNGPTPKNFNTQFDINILVGAKFKVGDYFTFKPCLQYCVPMVALYNSGVMASNGSSATTELNVSGYQLKIGLITDIGFKK